MDRDNNKQDIRSKAEDYFRHNAPDNEFLKTQDKDRIIHELRVHQVELEMQNEELRNTQLELERAKKEYSDLFENAPSGYIILNTEGNILKVNQTAAGLLNQPAPSLVNKNITLFIHKDYQDSFHHFRRNLIKSNDNISAELVLNIEGKENHVLFEGKSITDHDNKEKQYRIIINDINLRKKIELEKKATEENYKALFNMANDAIFILSDNGKILDVNSSTCDILNCSPFNLQEKDIKDLFPPDKKETYYRNILSSGDELFEAQLIDSDNNLIPFEMSTSPINFRGIKSIFIIGRDIRERMRHQKELDEIISQKEKFFSIITHNLKSPFVGFINQSEELISDFNNMTIEQLEEKSGSLNQSAKKLYELLENLLEWTTLQSGKSAFDPEVHDMSELIFNTLYIHKNLLEQKNIKVTNKVDVNTLVKIDYKMIMSVLQNLVSNAIKFMDEEGELTITSDENEEMLAIAVSDTGAGISPENIDRIFSIDDHPSLANGRTRGAGLGLLLCKEFVEKHGGEIAVESQVGIGTTFTFTVPAAKDCIIPKS